MFTGIIEELGMVKSIKRNTDKQRITLSCQKILEDIHLGDSIAVNGVCLTVVDFDKTTFSADVMNETFSRSSLGALSSGSLVDLERAMSSQGRFGGHVVSGHIDGTGTIRNIRKDGNAIWFEISADEKLLNYIVEKGSIAIDGISLTVADISKNSFQVSIIPHTLKSTVLGFKKRGDIVNLENDIIGKYVKKFIDKSQENKGLTREFLLSNGF